MVAHSECHQEVTCALKALPPVCEPRWAWWLGPAPLCSRRQDTGSVQKPPPAVPAACGWRWCGVASWLGKGKLCSAYSGRQPWGSHTVTPSSPTRLYLFSAERKWVSAPVSGLPLHDTRKLVPQLVKEHFTNHSVKKEGLHWLRGSHCHQATWELRGFARKRYQNRRDLTEIINAAANKMTHLANWWAALTLIVHLMAVMGEAEESDLIE